ncbi:mannan endo-1,4-beta-mannosidase [Marivirga lumbricoides]|uniref:Mannan endo-1,4-beta-mannosidase n=1 Tax=Marivirga lumbricoides TaxID=1046115 RepID=A0ABQ1M668_9BACT|nr:mannan endo-1,4-beta-mannosidase [Marivirga lumbricoides]
MKETLYICLFLSFIILTACNKDDETIKPSIEEEMENPEPNDEERFILQPEETTNFMVDPAATPETVALFYNLKINSETSFVVGQQDALAAFYQNLAGDADMKKTTGSNPGLLGSDFMFITDDQNNENPENWFYQQELKITSDAISAYNQGMINTFCWHFREPYEGKSFYTSEMTSFQKFNAFKSILPGGENHEYYKLKLQKVAQVAQNFIGANGSLAPVIFRPFHEFDKDFFWWGNIYSTPEEFKEVWRFTVEYLRDELKVHNFLYAFSPDNSYLSKEAYLSRYPGDEYVDVVGMDNYGDIISQDEVGISIANEKLKVVSDLALEKVKVAAFTETGYFVNPFENSLTENFYTENIYQVLTANNIEIAYMIFWQNYTDSYTVPTPGMPGEQDFIDFSLKEDVLLLKNMPDMYSFPEQMAARIRLN